MNEKYSIIYSPEAMNDLREIYAYIAFEIQVPDTAEKQVNRIRKNIHSLDTMPMRHAMADWEPWQSMGMHKLPVGNYIVYYMVDADTLTVTVIRIFYGGRNVEDIIAGI